MMEFRQSVEYSAVELSAKYAVEEDFERLRSCVQAMRDAFGDLDGFSLSLIHIWLHAAVLGLKAVMTVFLVKALHRRFVFHKRNGNRPVFDGGALADHYKICLLYTSLWLFPDFKEI